MTDTQTAISSSKKYHFLSGGGEMGELMRAKDWSTTAVGTPDQWPQSLRTTLSIILNAKFPMFLWWGEELTCFYNDAYRPSLGNDGKHPGILGMPAEKAWSEIWPIIKPLIDQVLAGGEAQIFEDTLVPIYRNGKIEDVYWTFSYSAVIDESGKPGGVLVNCIETTEKILNAKKIAHSENKFKNLIKESPIATAVFTGENFVVELANAEALKLWGKNKNVIGKKILEAMPELEGQPYMDLLKNVYTSGETYHGKEDFVNIEVNGKIEPAYVNFIYKALRDGDGKIYGILTMGYNVTEQVEARKKIEYNEERLRLTAETAMLGTFDLKMPEREFVGSKRVYEIFGIADTNISYDTLFSAIHPDDLHIREAANKLALTTGRIGYEVRLIRPDKSIRWISAYGKVFYGEDKNPSRVLGTIMDITDQKKFLNDFQASEKRFRNTVMQANVGITILKGADFFVEMANETYLEIIDRKEEDFVGKPLFEGLPEVREVIEPLVTSVLRTGISFEATEFPIPITRKGDTQIGYFNFAYQALRENDGSISGIIVVVNEITSIVKAKHLLAENEKEFRNVIMQSPIPMTILRGEEFVMEMTNDIMLKTIWRRKQEDIIGKKLFEAYPELNTQVYLGILKKVFTSGEPYKANESVAYLEGDDGMKKFYFDYEYAPLFDTDGTVSGIMVTANDVTEKVLLRINIEAEEARLRLAIDATKLATWDLDLQTSEMIHSPRLAEIFGHDSLVLLTHQQMRDQIHPDDLQLIIEKAFNEAMQTGIYYYQARVIRPDKTIAWIKTQGKVIFENESIPQRLIGTLTDVTESKIAEEKLAMLAAIVESSEDAIVSKKLNGFITSWNAGAQRIFGYRADEIIGEHITKLIPADRLEEEPKILARLQLGERVDHFETKRITKDKKILDISLTISPIKDAEGNIIGASKIARDITKQKETERLVTESEQRFKAIADSAPVMIWMSGTDKLCYFFNKGWLDFTGRTLEQEQGNGWAEGIHPEDLQRCLDIYVSSFDERKEFYMEYRLKAGDGEYKWISDKGVPRYSIEGDFLGYISGCMNIDEQKTFAEKLAESETRFRLLTNVMPQFIWIADPQGNLYYFNQSVYQYSGLNEREAMNGGWLKIIHPDDKEENIKKWAQSIATGEDFILEHRFRKYNGDYRWQLSRAVPHKDSSGRIQMWIGTSTDIHDQKVSSEQLKKSELLFKTISNTSPVGLWMTDTSGQNSFVNDTWIKWTGISLEKQHGHGWLTGVLEEDKLTIPSFEQAFKRREKYTAEFRILRQDNEVRWCLTEGSPYYDISGEFAGYAGSVTDITEIKKLEQQKDFFISMASHELKTPITSIKGYVQILQSMHKDSPDTFLKTSLGTINKQIGTLTKLIADLLDMSKIKTGSLQLNKEHFSINDMIHETIEEIKHAQPSYRFFFYPETESIVYADRLRVAQVLINFLTNAIKYSPHSNMVTVRSAIIDNNVIVSVIDSGIGISKQDQEKIFERFYRVEGKDENTFPGFGIGLFIAAEIIHRHNGKIQVESEPGKGSAFSFSLPLDNQL
ncbi:MAG TPA: PAS domain S-box protein [Ferruginibacter sp.]|jgi:PAS domain S-box-containing protein|nr:PAS domain S-box protein [Ferruginibacter sp.]